MGKKTFIFFNTEKNRLFMNKLTLLLNNINIILSKQISDTSAIIGKILIFFSFLGFSQDV